MKRLTPLLLALLLLVSGLTVVPASALEAPVELVEVSKENLDRSFSKHPSLLGESKNELSGFLSLKDLEDQLDPQTKVRVVVELHSDPVIVEATKRGLKVDEMSSSEVASIQQNLLSEQASVKQQLTANQIETSTTDGQDVPLADDSLTVAVNAFTTYVEVEDLDSVAQLPSVKEVYVSNEYERPEVIVNQATATQMVDAPIAWNEYELKGEGQVVAVIDSGIDPSHKDFVLSDPSQAKLDRQSVSSLGLPGLYYNDKVPYAYNYYDLSQKVLDISTSGQHGQHVAGSVAANGEVKGVAPEAQLLGMKVFSDDFDYATTFSDVYLKAIDDAIALGADVLNMSLGSPAGFYVEGSVEDVALKNALENGIVSTISAGNEFNMMTSSATWADYLVTGTPNAQMKNPDVGVVGSPSLNEASLSVASIENTYQVTGKLDYTIEGETKEASMTQASGSPDPWVLVPEPTEVVRVGIGLSSDFEEVGDAVQGKIALVMRGNTFTDSLANAQNAGAVGIIIYNHKAGGEAHVSMAGGELAKIPYVFIGHASGTELSEAAEAGLAPTVTFTEAMAAFENPNGELMSSFSSWGSTPDLRMKPEITAPGGMIYSTQNNNTYGVMSGTSMAAPNAAGGSAVVQQHIKTSPYFETLNLTAQQRALLAKTLLMNTATTVYDEFEYPVLVRQQGAGLMNVANAIATPVYVVESSSGNPKVEFGDTTSNTLSTTLTLTNLSDEDESYDVSSIMLSDYIVPHQGYLLNANGSDVVEQQLTSATEVTVPAGGSVDLPVTMVFEHDLNQYVEGFIKLTSKDGSQVELSVPFLGFYGDWDSLDVLDELRWNLLDGTTENDPTFQLTTLVNFNGNNFYFVNSNEKVWINPGNQEDQAYGTGNVGLLATVLRNIEEANFRVLDENGEVVREIGQQTGIRKIVRLATSAPYTYLSDGTWDGHIDGQPVQDGETYTYQVELLRTQNSTPQVLEFEVNVDNTLPTIENISYDPNTYNLYFDAKDDGSGLATFDILNLLDQSKYIIGGTGAGQAPSLVAQEGVIRYSVNIKSILGEGNSVIYILANDKAGNVGLNGLMVGPLQSVDIMAGAPQVNTLTPEDSVLTGSSTPGFEIKVYQGEDIIATTVADESGNFSVEIGQHEEGTQFGVSATNPENEKESPQTRVMVVVTDLTVTANVLVDGQEPTTDLSSVKFTLNEVVGSLEGNVLTFENLETGTYPLLVEGLADVGLYLQEAHQFDVTSTSTEFDVQLTRFNPAYTGLEEGPYGQGQISITTPGLLEAYNSAETQLSGKAWGYELITQAVANEEFDLELTKVKEPVVDPSGALVFFGDVFHFDETVNLADDYYEMPFMIRSHDDRTAQTVRRFWVDTEAPTISATLHERNSNSSTALITIDTADNMSVLEVMRGDDFINTHDWTGQGFDTRNVVGSDTDLVPLVDGLNTITYTVYDIAGNSTSTTIEVMKADKTVLDALLKFVGLMDERHPELEKAYQAGLLVSADPMATQEEIDAAVEALYAAQESLKDAPVLSGVADINVYVGDEVDLLAGVSATDSLGQDITDQVVVSPETVDTSVVGTTEVTYSVTDVAGHTTTVTVTVTVLERPVVEVNKAALRMAITIAEDLLDSDLISDAYRARLSKVVESGKAVLEDPNATQEEVDVAAELIRLTLDPNSPINQGPTLVGVVDTEVEKDTEVDLLANVSASDPQDGDLSAQVKVDPTTLDTSKVGDTIVTYTVSDSDGNTTSQKARFTVIEKSSVSVDTSELEDLLKQAQEVDTDKLPEVLRAELEVAIKRATDLLASQEPTQELVDTVAAQLKAVLAKVKEHEEATVENPTPGKTPQEKPTDKPSEKPTEKPSDKTPSKNNLPSTGHESTLIYTLAGVSVISIGILLVLRKKKEA